MLKSTRSVGYRIEIIGLLAMGLLGSSVGLGDVPNWAKNAPEKRCSHGYEKACIKCPGRYKPVASGLGSTECKRLPPKDGTPFNGWHIFCYSCPADRSDYCQALHLHCTV